MKNPFAIFKIKHEEKWLAVVALLYIVLWNALVIYKYADRFFEISNNYYRLFVRTFHISGFDPLSYVIISTWDTVYNIYRHPLLAFFMYVPNQINQGLIMLTGTNFASIIMALLLVFCGFYSFILLYRTFREVIGLNRSNAYTLSWLTFSFAYVMVAISVPDHFALSMFMLVLTLYVAGRKLKARHPFTKWQTVLFFIITAGISLNNGIKIFLANLFVNGKRFWHPANIIVAIILPSLIIWVGATIEWNHFKRPYYVAKLKKQAQKDSIQKANTYAKLMDTTSLKTSSAIHKAYIQILKQQKEEKKQQERKKPWIKHAGKPINKSEFGQWTDISTPRLPSLIENVFGESTQLHDSHLLEDVMVARPVIVKYNHAYNYFAEAILVLLFIGGIWSGRRSRFLWLALSFFAFDFFIHFILGFGLNEVYIMSPHWLFIITLSIGFLLKKTEAMRLKRPLQTLTVALTVYLLVWNGMHYIKYLI